ncbi:hypothetical protein IFM89_036293 [Coptis chinensis]|uniref:Pentatricopeptide repeat-containing protein n=1 Tax=Coptis chinensis TaxID=261450 RepID=A0A835IJ66_9MAGN|nr:hypothetical protein IFM89_036293 [Coptis chinensis]
MHTRDVISWNAMINACVCNQRFQIALELFWEMRWKETSGVDSTTLVIVVSALSRMIDLKRGRVVHCLSLKYGMGSDCFLCNSLVDMYAKCGELGSAECVFEGMEFRDSSSWNSMMSGCAYNGYPERSWSYFKDMGLYYGCVRVDNFSLSCTISACSSLGDLQCGQTVHGLAIRLGYEETANISIGNALISLYSQCGDIEDAELVFNKMVYKHDVVSWNSMIHGFATNGMILEAFSLLHEMQHTWSVHPDLVTLISIVPLCTEFNLLREGRSVHGFIVRRKMRLDLSLKNSIMDMYLKCNILKPAELMFTILPERDLISWNTMIAGYSHNVCSVEAQGLFQELHRSGPSCNELSLLAVLSSCDSFEELEFGESVHCLHLKLGFSNNFLVTNDLMFMYINCGDVIASLALLRNISDVADIVSWNTIIVGCAWNGYSHEALETFNQICCSSYTSPDSITFVNVVSACGDLQFLSAGRSLHGFTIKTPVELDVRVRNSLITMYSRCKDVESARLVFNASSFRNLYSWNCMISGLAQNKDGQRALELFHLFEYEPNEITIVSILSTSTQTGSLRHGKQIHGYVFRFGVQQNLFISTALMDMYSKCGRLELAIHLFKDSPEKSVASWNSMISAYGFHGQGKEAIKLFSEMCESGTSPTKSTFISLLSACSHSGLLEGRLYYELMSTEFGVEPTIEHHVCYADMLGRSGKLSEAYEFIKDIQPQQQAGVWGALLSACKYHGDIKMGKQVAEHLFNIDPENAGYYVSLFNIYTADGRWSDAMDIRKNFQDRMLRKPPGYSLIDICSG